MRARGGQRQKVASSLYGGIRRIRRQRRIFSPRAGCDAAINLVCRDLDDPGDLGVQAGLQQDLDAEHVRRYELCCSRD
jgi:hypothetical protein